MQLKPLALATASCSIAVLATIAVAVTLHLRLPWCAVFLRCQAPPPSSVSQSRVSIPHICPMTVIRGAGIEAAVRISNP